jgi:hypothetical protein
MPVNSFAPSRLCGIFIFFSSSLLAQQSNVPLNYEWIQESEARMVQARGFDLSPTLMRYESDPDIVRATTGGDSTMDILSVAFPMHTSMRPWIEQGHPLRKNVVAQNAPQRYRKERVKPVGKWAQNYHLRNSLLQVEREPQNDEPVFRLYVDPLLNLQYMSVADDTSSSQFYINTRGVTAHGDIGTKVSFETSFWENQAFFPRYLAEYVTATGVVPGQGRWKRFKTTGFDFAQATGYVSYSPSKYFNVQIGSGKHFVGDGYRSLLLSDNAFSYPYARLTGWFGRNKTVQYTVIYASLMNLTAGNVITPLGTERLFQKKAASFYQLSTKLGRTAEISLFQGLIWTAADDRNKQSLTLGYINPIIFTSIPTFGMSDRHNFLVGTTFRVDLLKTIRIYGQLMADDFGKKGTVHHKTGMQAGVKYFNAFTLKHLHLQVEYNRVQPYTYAATDPGQSYTHYAQPLAHPFGANFTEITGSLQYKIGDFFLHVRASQATVGADSSANNFGQNVFLTDYQGYYPATEAGHTLGQGEKNTVTWLDARVGYMVSYASNLNICLGYTTRNVTAGATSSPTSFVYVAVRTSLTNTYYDLFRK